MCLIMETSLMVTSQLVAMVTNQLVAMATSQVMWTILVNGTTPPTAIINKTTNHLLITEVGKVKYKN